MAEHPEPWRDTTPEQRPLFGVAPAFGLAREAGRPPQEFPAAPTRTEPRRRRRERGPFLTYLQMPWSYSDGNTGDRWHRVRCLLGRHGMGGGHTMQFDGTVTFIERRCRWCGTEPKAL